MTHSIFSFADQMMNLLKHGHAELEDAFNTLRRTTNALPTLRVSLGSGDGLYRRSAACRYTAKTFEFFAEDGNQRYEAKLPLDAASGQPVTIAMTKMVQGKPVRTELKGVDILKAAEVPKEFRELHNQMLSVLRRAIPPELLASLVGDAIKVGVETQEANDEADGQPLEAEKEQAITDHKPAEQQDEAQTSSPSSKSDKRELGPAKQLVDVRIRREDKPDLCFRGELLGSVTSGFWHGRTQRLSVFRTRAGKIVAVREGLSLWPNENPRLSVEVYDDLAAITGLFGYSTLAKQLYTQLALQTEERLD